ncbi:MAG: hypothetical protein Q7U28_12280 [Aquabacterium sp.]|nr:hypothetical protein [Aquabacterium sp.]
MIKWLIENKANTEVVAVYLADIMSWQGHANGCAEWIDRPLGFAI